MYGFEADINFLCYEKCCDKVSRTKLLLVNLVWMLYIDRILELEILKIDTSRKSAVPLDLNEVGLTKRGREYISRLTEECRWRTSETAIFTGAISFFASDLL